jgi:hypothetical protein
LTSLSSASATGIATILDYHILIISASPQPARDVINNDGDVVMMFDLRNFGYWRNQVVPTATPYGNIPPIAAVRSDAGKRQQCAANSGHCIDSVADTNAKVAKGTDACLPAF